jgi:hypothetical protein
MDKLNLKGKVTVRLIDKKTGKIDYENTLDNAIILNGARCVMYALTGISTPNEITRAVLFDSDKNPIGNIGGTWGTIQDSGSALSCKITCTDSSNSSYTFRYLTLDTGYPQQPVYIGGYFANDRGSDITKQSNKILIIEWTISVGYNSPP